MQMAPTGLKVMADGQVKRRGFTGPGLGLANHILSGQHRTPEPAVES